ncbi:MAG: glycosyltransferase [Planctomycetota bacterium]
MPVASTAVRGAALPSLTTAGAAAVEPSLTVVLPIHNAERTLRRDVADLLEAASDLTPNVDVLIVDDASSDDSFETASDLSHLYRQVRVLRRSSRRGLAQTLKEVQANIQSDVVIVHDGASRISGDQLRLVWRQQQVLGAMRDQSAGRQGVSFADLRRPAITQPAMEAAHRRLMGFQPVASNSESDGSGATAADDGARRDDAHPTKPGRGVGAVPPLPRGNVLGSITSFALGE